MASTNRSSDLALFLIILQLVLIFIFEIMPRIIKWFSSAPITDEKIAQFKEYIYDLKNNRIGSNDPVYNTGFKSYRTIENWILIRDHSDFKSVRDSAYLEFYFESLHNTLVPNEEYFGLIAFLVIFYDDLKQKLNDPEFVSRIINFYAPRSYLFSERNIYIEDFKRYRNIFLKNTDVAMLDRNEIIDCLSFLSMHLDYISKIERGYTSQNDYFNRLNIIEDRRSW